MKGLFAVALQWQRTHLAHYAAVCLVGMLAAPSVCMAAPGAPDPALQYTRRLWRVQDGLPENTVQALTQAADGFLWIGTAGGLARFDGAQFSTFGESSTPGFSANSILCILPTRDGGLWLGSEGSGLLHYSKGRVQTFGAAQGLTDGFVRSLLRDVDGTLWIGTDDGLFQLQPKGLPHPGIHRVDAHGTMSPIAVHAIMEDREHRVWVGGSRLVVIANGVVQNEKLPGLYSQNRVKSLLQTADGTVWVGTVSGLDRRVAGHFMAVPGVAGTVRTLRQTDDGTLWIGTIGHGLWTERDGKLTHISVPGLLPSRTVLSLYEDRSHQVWVGTQDGLVRLSSTPVHVLPLTGGSDSDFGTISPDGPDKVWVVSSGLFRVSNGVARPYRLPPLGSTPVRNVIRDRAGDLWVGTDGSGAFHLTPHGVTHYSAPRELTNNFIRAFLEGRRGDMWIATDEGLSHVTASGVHKYGVQDGLAYFSTRCLLEDAAGDLWIGTDDGLSHWRNGVFLHDALTRALRKEKVWSMLQDENGFLWIGTRDSGLFRYRHGQLTKFTTAQGLPSNSIYGLVDDGRGQVWFSGPNTLASASLAQLDSDVPAIGGHLDATSYDVPFGAQEAQFYGGRQPSAFVDLHGRVWFASSDGAVYAPRQGEGGDASAMPPLFLRRITVDGAPVKQAGGALQISAHASRVEFTYAPLMLRPQNAVRFRYRLEGYDQEWSYAGEGRTATYTNLPAGHYRFVVRAFFASDRVRTSEISVGFYKAPYLYQTWWFAVLCVALILGIGWAIYRSHIHGIRLRFEAVLAERNRLAREMHDTVIQGCTSISALLEAIASRDAEQAESPERALLGYARTQVRTTIHEAREAVWDLRHSEEDQHDLLLSLSSLASNASQEYGVSVLFRSEGRPFEVSGSTAHELLMTVREAVYNAMLHSHAQNVVVRADFQPQKLQIYVADNGTGFDAGNSPASDGTHYGIIGMRERIHRLGGELNLRSAPGQGTEIEIIVKRSSLLLNRMHEASR